MREHLPWLLPVFPVQRLIRRSGITLVKGWSDQKRDLCNSQLSLQPLVDIYNVASLLLYDGFELSFPYNSTSSVHDLTYFHLKLGGLESELPDISVTHE